MESSQLAHLASLPPVTFPSALQPLFQPKRYKGAYGGRYGGRSWGFARALLLLNLVDPARTLCARELQKSIRDSVHKLIADQITRLGMNYLYDVQTAIIKGREGTQCAGADFAFEGIRSNPDGVKSYEGIKRCWIEEGDKTSEESWKIIIPTIRMEGSEIWCSWNTRKVTDPTHKRLVIQPPGDLLRVTKLVDGEGRETGGTITETTRAFVIFSSYLDNPWVSPEIMAEILELKARDYDEYLHVYGGAPVRAVAGAVYKEELRELDLRRGVREVPYDKSLGVDVFFDIGMGHYTALWFKQTSMWEHRYIRFYKNRLQGAEHYIRYLQSLPYAYDTIWLPHDASAKRFGTKLTVEEQFKEAFPSRVRITPKLSIEDGINAMKTIFPNSFFDADNCADGLADIADYSYAIDPVSKQWSSNPDQSAECADAADALRYSAVASGVRKRRGVRGVVEEVARRLLPPTEQEIMDYGGRGSGGSTGWLGG